MPQIHPTAIVDSKAVLADNVEIRAYSIIKGAVTLGAGTIVHEHSHVHGQTTIGSNCQIGPAAFLGLDPQHRGYAGAPTRLTIGNDNVFREGVSVHRSFKPEEPHATTVGHRNYLMGHSHVGHDCAVGNDVTLANGALLGGHVTIGDRCFIGGGAVVHQFVRIGRLAVMSGNDRTARDIPPFAAARELSLKGFNIVGCRRAEIPSANIKAIRAAYHCIHTNRNLAIAVQKIRETLPLVPEVQELLDFIATTKRGIQPSIHFARDVHLNDED